MATTEATTEDITDIMATTGIIDSRDKFISLLLDQYSRLFCLSFCSILPLFYFGIFHVVDLDEVGLDCYGFK